MACFENSCNTCLSLCSPQNNDQNPNHHNIQQNKRYLSSYLKFDHILPSLSLGLPQEELEEKGDFFNQLSQASNSHDSGVSSYSNSSVKKQHEMIAEEELEVERESRKIEREDLEEEGSVRKKLRLTKQQSIILEDSFKEHSTLNPKHKQELAKQLSLRPRQVEVWFQNRRARTKLKQTELEYELMKKCCETLTHENKRLLKELQVLKAMRANQSFYLQLPAATHTICPSCERIVNSNDVSGNSHLHDDIGAKPQFYDSLTHPSAAC